jgi:hypothetical protein
MNEFQFLSVSDSLDSFAASVVGSIVMLVIASSLYDRILRNTIGKVSSDHYKTPMLLRSHQILTLFSIRRNWHILSAPVKSDVRDLRFIQAVRTLTMFGVIIGHCGWFSIVLPSINPIFMENVSCLNPPQLRVHIRDSCRFIRMFHQC